MAMLLGVPLMYGTPRGIRLMGWSGSGRRFPRRWLIYGTVICNQVVSSWGIKPGSSGCYHHFGWDIVFVAIFISREAICENCRFCSPYPWIFFLGRLLEWSLEEMVRDLMMLFWVGRHSKFSHRAYWSVSAKVWWQKLEMKFNNN